MNLCKYRDMFGKPNTGIHSIRIGNIAVVDVLLTILLAYAIASTFDVSFLPDSNCVAHYGGYLPQSILRENNRG